MVPEQAPLRDKPKEKNMQTRITKTIFISALFAVSSCGNMFNPGKRKDIKVATMGNPLAFELEDPDCNLEGEKPTFSDHVSIWMMDQSGKLREQVFDLSDVSRLGLESNGVSEALYSSEDVDHREFGLRDNFHAISQFEDTKALQALEKMHRKGSFNKINFCRPSGGYRADSIENAALAAFVAINETNKIHDSLQIKPNIKRKLAKIKLFVHPKIFAMQSRYLKSYYVDNAFWADFKAYSLIAVLPHSQEWEDANKLRYWETPGVFSHEYGHHIFHTYGPNFESPSKLFLYDKQLNRINSGFNEGFADLVSYFSLSARKQLNPALLLSGNAKGHQNRNIKTPSLKYESKSHQLKIPKTYNFNVVEALGSTRNYKFNQIDFEGYIIQKIHESGAIMAYVFNKLLDGYGYWNDPRKKMELLISWLHQQEYSMALKDHLTSPDTHLESCLKSMLKELDQSLTDDKKSKLSDKARRALISEHFPYFFLKWTLGWQFPNNHHQLN